ncbi:MAG: hypothetical protein ACK5V0_03875, partial [Alphaproteobacteria bacterium]
VRDFRFHSSLSYATSPYANMLSALNGLGNSRVFAGFSPETLMVRGRNGRAFSLRIGGFSPKLEGWSIFPTRSYALIRMSFLMLRCSMSWWNGCLGEWNWGRKVDRELQGWGFKNLQNIEIYIKTLPDWPSLTLGCRLAREGRIDID